MDQVIHTCNSGLINPAELNDMIQLTSLVTDAEAYTPDGEILDVKLELRQGSQMLSLLCIRMNLIHGMRVQRLGLICHRMANAKLTILMV